MHKLVLALSVSCFVPANFLAQSETGSKRPNILWIIAEDLGPELACYGTAEVRTPRLDRLAREGVRYSRAFTTSPVCSTSRSAFMTGMYQTSIGAHNHRSHRNDGFQLPEGVKVLTDWFRAAGYYTGNIRRLSDTADEKFYKGTGKTDWNFKYTGKPFDTGRWSDLKDNQPFYAQVNFSETHRGAAWNNSHKHIDRVADPAKVVLPPYYPDHPVARKDWAQYLNTVMALDKKVGYVLDRLQQDGLADNTIVVFLGDHGRAMIRGKQWPYDSGLHIPLIIRYPKGMAPPNRFAAGTVDARIVEAIDLTATSLFMAGIERPAKMQGRVFLGPNVEERQYAFGARDRCDETVFRIRTARDTRFRYIRNFMPERPFLQRNRYKERTYPVIALMRKLHGEGKLGPIPSVLMAKSRPAEELYDTESDQYEVNNLVDSKDHAAVLARMRSALEKWIIDSNDQGRTPEDPAIIARWERRARDRTQRARQQRNQKLLLSWPDEKHEFQFSDPKVWRLTDGNELELHGKPDYKPEVRSPRCIALIDGVQFGNFTLEAELLQTGRDYGHRDMCIFFGFESPTKFYYVHLASKADKNAHNVFRVADKPRTNIATKTTKGIEWGREQWHKVKVVRNMRNGLIRVFFDDMQTPIMEATDKTFRWGMIGFGSFDDTGKVRNIKVRGQRSRATPTKMFR